MARHSLRRSHDVEKSRLDVDGGHIARARDWREHHDLYLGEISSAETTSGGRRIRSTGDGSRRIKTLRQSSDFRVLSRLSRLSGSQPSLRRIDRLQLEPI